MAPDVVSDPVPPLAPANSVGPVEDGVQLSVETQNPPLRSDPKTNRVLGEGGVKIVLHEILPNSSPW